MKFKKILFTFIIMIFSVILFCGCSLLPNNNTATPNTEYEQSVTEQNQTQEINFYKVLSVVFEREVTSTTLPNGYTISSDGSYCTVDSNPNDDTSLSGKITNTAIILSVWKVNKELGLPDYLKDEMASTSYLLGRQTEVFEKISVTWWYHPDRGLNVIYKKI